jgi:pimeloyl-ACP methyl ester carboxylesterase
MTRVLGALSLALMLLALMLLALPLRLAAAADNAPGRDGFVEVEGGKLRYEACGSGPRAVVLVHDGVLDSSSWDGVWPALCARYRVVRYDRRGYGRSPEATTPYSAVEDLSAVMRATGADHAVLVGSSAGGGLALDFALAHPGQVDGLLLIGPDASGQKTSVFFKLRLLRVFLDLQHGRTDRAIERASHVGFVIVPGHEDARQRFVEILHASPQDLTHSDQDRPRPSALPRLGEIKVPTMILVGDHDAGENKAHARQIARLVPGAELELMPDSGHMLYLEHPDAFSAQVISFVEGLKRTE